MATIRTQVVDVVVYDERMYSTDGTVGRWAKRVERNYLRFAKQEAPVNTRDDKGRSPYPVGALRASIRGTGDRTGPRARQVTVSVNVPYAIYVLRGTTGPIMSNRLWAAGGIVPNRNYLISRRNGGIANRGALEDQKARDRRRFGMRLPQNGPGRDAVFPYYASGQAENPFLDRAADLTSAIHPSIRRGGGVFRF